MSSQIVMTSPTKRPKVALPYAFTEQDVVMRKTLWHSFHNKTFSQQKFAI